MKKITLLMALLIGSLGFSQDPATGPSDPPARDAGDVVSIYNGITTPMGDDYTNVGGVGFDAFGTAVTIADLTLGDGNTVKKYTNHNYSGIGGGSYDVSLMETLHIDVYFASAAGDFRIKLEDASGPATEISVEMNPATGTWLSYDINLSNFVSPNLANLKWIVPVTTSANTNFYFDNIYFYRTPVDPAQDATLSDLTVNGATIDGFGPGNISYTYSLPTGTTIAPTVGATATNVGASAEITQAPGVPGAATIEVTAADGITTKTYTVSFVALGPATDAPTPPARPESEVISIFSDAYTSSVGSLIYTDNGGTNMDTYNTNWCAASTTLVMIDGNPTNKVTGLGCEGIDWQSARPIDASAMTRFHIDFYTDETDLVNKVFTVKFSQWSDDEPANDPDNGERSAFLLNLESVPMNGKPALQTGWNFIDLVIDDTFTGPLRRDDIVQMIISSNLTGDLWYDNAYFHQNTTLGIEDNELRNVRIFPNPTQDSWNIKTQNNEISSIRVYDVLGKNVMSLTPNKNEAFIDGATLRTGIYFAKIATELGTKSVKLIRE